MTAVRATARRSTRRRTVRTLALGLVALATTIAGQPASAASAAPLTGVDLSNYVRVGRYDLPEPTRTTPPAGSLLAQEASSVTYDADTHTLFVVGDGGTSVVQVSTTGQLIDSMTLASGGSPAGTAFYDTEGITYVGGGKFAMTEERDRQVDEFTYSAGTVLTRGDAKTVKLGTTIDNIGLEGISNDPQSGGFLVVKEKDPQGIFQTDIDFDAGTATNGSPTTDDSIDLFAPALAGLSDFSDVFALSNLSTLTGADTSHLLVISQESGKIVNIDRSGNVSSTLTIHGDSGNPLSVPGQTDEGVTMDDDGDLYVVNEQGGGDVDHPQLWVYEPSTVPNQAPTAVTLDHATTSIAENTSTATRLKVADVHVADDEIGNDDLTLTGPDAADFEVDSNGLYLKAGTTLDYETKTSYTVSVVVDDPNVGGTPDATSDPYTLSVSDVVDEDPGTASVIVSEVSPWSSGDASYGADWFEVTNTGTAAADLTGWKMDDNSNDVASAVALNGVSSIAPGQSAVFVEGTATTADDFKASWFGTDVPPGLAIGSYEGSGVGLSTGGDAVNLFDALGDRATGVAFGTSITGFTFDNSAGAGSSTLPLPTISALSVAGTNGAFLADGQTGSPGTTSRPLVVSEVSPASSGNDSYAADWFEVTNTGAKAVDLTGWKMDDNSNALANAVALNGVTSIAPGQSVVFVEGDATTVAAFTTAWFGTDVPDGLAIGYYSGSGVGLSTNGDAINLFDALGDRVAGVSFGAVPDGVTFDNSAGLNSATLPLPAVSTLSVLGAHGAFVAGGETGSPGTIAPDVTAPTITYSANAGTYTTDEQVNITCAAADEPHGSGIATTDCAPVTGSGADFGVGTHVVTATATDNAGNVGTGSVTFTVTAADDDPPPAQSGDDGSTPPAVTTSAPIVAPAPISAPPLTPLAPLATKPAAARPKPKLSVGKSAKVSALAKGFTTTLTGLKAKSTVTLTVRLGTRTLVTIRATADKSGKAHVKLRLTKRQLAKLHDKKLALRFAVTGANGKTSTLTASLKVT